MFFMWIVNSDFYIVDLVLEFDVCNFKFCEDILIIVKIKVLVICIYGVILRG